MAVDIEGMAPLLQVFDMPTAIRFYRDVLGFDLVATSGRGEQSDWVLLRHGGVELMLNTAYEADTRPSAPDVTRFAGHADVGLFFGCADLESAYSYLVANGVQAEPPKVAPPEPARTSQYPPGYELRFVEGDGDARVTISTLNGDIRLCKK